ncbi:MAG: hypothetical protein ACRCW2_06275 [Cellulosilyticaceae bacterium]
MAVTESVSGVKVVLKLEKGSQTISGCKHDATGEALYNMGKAIGTLQSENVNEIVKIQETKLVLA